jgi:ABC-type glycerol-3-phosphate transport system permease component
LKPARILGLVVLILFAAAFSLPFLWQVSTSLKTEDQVGKSDLDLIPRAETLSVDGRRVEVKPIERKGNRQSVEIEEGPQKGTKMTP